MISETLVIEVKRLLAEGKLSQRKIAKLTGVSRGTVGAIASGRRRDPHFSKPSDYVDFGEPKGPPGRCAGCGAIVYAPCRLCTLRGLLAAREYPRRPERRLGSLELDLRDEHRARYEKIAARRRREGEYANLEAALKQGAES